MTIRPGMGYKRRQMAGTLPPPKNPTGRPRTRCIDCGTKQGVDKNHGKCRRCLVL